MLCRHFGFNGTIFDRTKTKHFNKSKYILAGDLMCYSELSNRTSCCIYLAPFTVNRSNNFNLPFVRCKYDCVLYNNTCSFGIFIGRELCVIKIHTNIEIIINTREGIIIFSVKTKGNTANGGGQILVSGAGPSATTAEICMKCFPHCRLRSFCRFCRQNSTFAIVFITLDSLE